MFENLSKTYFHYKYQISVLQNKNLNKSDKQHLNNSINFMKAFKSSVYFYILLETSIISFRKIKHSKPVLSLFPFYFLRTLIFLISSEYITLKLIANEIDYLIEEQNSKDKKDNFLSDIQHFK